MILSRSKRVLLVVHMYYYSPVSLVFLDESDHIEWVVDKSTRVEMRCVDARNAAQ